MLSQIFQRGNWSCFVVKTLTVDVNKEPRGAEGRSSDLPPHTVDFTARLVKMEVGVSESPRSFLWVVDCSLSDLDLTELS